MRFRNILFPIDFSERCAAVAPFVSAVAKRDNACLILASFVETSAMWYGAAEGPAIADLNIPRIIEETECDLTRFGSEYFPGMQVNVAVEEGEPGFCIADYARAEDIGLIMMPARGRGRFRAALLGSVTVKVLHDAGCPVWTIAHCETLNHAFSPEWRTVVCAVEAADSSSRVIRYAGELASSYGSAVRLVHAFLPPPHQSRKAISIATFRLT
jgi:nucleotide-binding universal stress UspA family protein